MNCLDSDPDARRVRAAMDEDLLAALGGAEAALFTRARSLFNAALRRGDERMWFQFYRAVSAVVATAERRLQVHASAREACRRLRAFLEENSDLEGRGALPA